MAQPVERITPAGLYRAHGLLCLAAPNRYRKMLAECRKYEAIRGDVIARMSEEFAVPRPIGIDIDPGTFDMILIWMDDRDAG